MNEITSGSVLFGHQYPLRTDPIGFQKGRTLLEIFIFILFALIFPSPAQAQTISLSIWPPILETVIQPGKAVTQVYKLKNLGDDTIIKASVVPFTPGDEFGHVFLRSVPENSGSDLFGFFTLQNANKTLPLTFPLKSGQTEDLVLKITIPKDEPEADHYYTFLFESSTQGLISGTGTIAQASIGSNILITISNTGVLKPIAKIEQFFVTSRRDLEMTRSHLVSKQGATFLTMLDSFSPIYFNLLVKNTSSTRLKAVGQIEIKNIFGGTATTLPIREDNVLANSSRQLQSEGTVPSLIFGKFTAKATITPKDTTNTISQTISFFVFPYKLILILFSLLTIYFFYRHNRIP